MSRDPYLILGVPKDATDDVIRKAYRKLAAKHHPDKHANATETMKARHRDKFLDVQWAYDLLMDQPRRECWDRNGIDQEAVPTAQLTPEQEVLMDLFQAAYAKLESPKYQNLVAFAESECQARIEHYHSEAMRLDRVAAKARDTSDRITAPSGCPNFIAASLVAAAVQAEGEAKRARDQAELHRGAKKALANWGYRRDASNPGESMLTSVLGQPVRRNYGGFSFVG